MSGLPKHTARYFPSMENVADHAGDPVSVFGESVSSGSREDDCAFAIVASMVAIFGERRLI